MKIKKFGFTLGEVLCALAIVGIVSAMALTSTSSPEKKAVKYLYMNAYNSLEKAYYNSTILGYNPFTEQEFRGISPVHSDSEDSGALILCRGLTSYINTPTRSKRTINGYTEDNSTSCSSTNLISLNADDDFTKLLSQNNSERSSMESKAQFYANNSMRFYITKMITYGDLKFYIVLVDVNGKKKPNSIVYTYKPTSVESEKTAEKNRIEPDIYAFAILNSGRVCPLGIPEYDTNVLTARFAYFNNDGDPLYTKKSMAYYQAKGSAWGFYSGTNPLTAYNIEEPYSMNDIIREAISAYAPNSKILKDFPNLSSLSPKTVESGSPYSCSNQDLESCYIFLDAYRQ